MEESLPAFWTYKPVINFGCENALNVTHINYPLALQAVFPSEGLLPDSWAVS